MMLFLLVEVCLRQALDVLVVHLRKHGYGIVPVWHYNSSWKLLTSSVRDAQRAVGRINAAGALHNGDGRVRHPFSITAKDRSFRVYTRMHTHSTTLELLAAVD